MSKFWVNDSLAGVTTGPYDTLAEAYEDANIQLHEYRKNADEGWGLDEGDLAIYETPNDFNAENEELSDFRLVSNNVEIDRRYVEEGGDPIYGFDYVCNMAMSGYDPSSLGKED